MAASVAGGLKVEVRVAWWLPWYLRGVVFFAILMGAQPDMEKVRRMVERALCVVIRRG